MKIKIEQFHIDKGKAADPRKCPTALAIAEQTGRQISVGTHYVNLPTYPILRIEMPPEICKWISDFDIAATLEHTLPDPIEFELAIRPTVKKRLAQLLNK